MKKVLSILVMSAVLFSCNGGDDGKTPSSKIGLSVSTLNNPFFVSLVDGAKEQAKKLGVELIVVDAADSVAKQVNDIEDLLSKNVQVLIVNPVDSDAVAPAVKDAEKASIPIIAVDRMVNGAKIACSIASDNVQGAELATNYLVELVGKDAVVAELQGVLGASATMDRGKGFHNIADTNLKVVAQQTANFNRNEGMSVTENIMQAHSDIKGIFAHNDEMALGAIAALGDKEVVVIGFDATDDAKTAVQEGKMAATIAQQPSLMGSTAVTTAMQIINKEEVPASIPVEVQLIKK